MIQFCLNQTPLRPGDGPMALVLAPTRELAQQIDKEVGGPPPPCVRARPPAPPAAAPSSSSARRARFVAPNQAARNPLEPPPNQVAAFGQSSRRSVRTCIVVGGVQMHEQRHELRAGVEVVVATPGRFIDHLQQARPFLGQPCRRCGAAGRPGGVSAPQAPNPAPLPPTPKPLPAPSPAHPSPPSLPSPPPRATPTWAAWGTWCWTRRTGCWTWGSSRRYGRCCR
jgi:hypothetical protein